MKCVFVPTGQVKQDEREHRCARCGVSRWSAYESHLIHQQCNSEGPLEAPEEVFMAALPEATRKRIGDRAKEFFEWFGFPPCGGCKERQKWLNEIDRKVFG